jgi:flavin reductase (DIM6/NTAB) family NADH-FMN oxidoreductase RutF
MLPSAELGARVSICGRECRLIEIVRLKDLDGKPADGWLALGQVVGLHIDPDYLHEGQFQTGKAGIIQRAGYSADYFAPGEQQLLLKQRPTQS